MSSGQERTARLVTALVVLACGAWIAWHWLPRGWTEKELAAGASRVWDIRRELLEHGTLPWWTPWFMSGSSYALQHAQGLPLVAWLGLSLGLSLDVAGRMVALLAIGASAVTMFACARRLLGSPWAAALAAVAYAMHPQQAFRAGGDEHVGLSVVFALVPLAWLTWTRATETGTLRGALPCALVLAALLWTSTKHVLVMGLLLGLGTLARGWPVGRSALRPALRGSLLVLLLGAGLGAFCIVPALEESQHARLFVGEDVTEWQRQLSFRSVLGLVDRDGVLTRPAIAASHPIAVPDAAERAARERLSLLKFESGTKYAGIVLLGLAAGAVLLGRRRADRVLLGTLAVVFLACVAAATGFDGVVTAHWATLRALDTVPGVPTSSRVAAVAIPLGALACLLALAYRWRRLRTGGVLVVVGLVALLLVPLFRGIAILPFFSGIRAPFVFYDIPATFALCLMAAFFVTDVIEAGRWRTRAPVIVPALIALVLIDHAPAARVMTAPPPAPRTMANVQAAYGLIRAADPEWTKTYYISTRNQHLLGPIYSGKPQVYEAWTKWMSPLGIGLLNDRSWNTPDANRAYLDVIGARWVVFDKGDAELMASPLARQMLDFYRRWFVVRAENDDLVVFHNSTAWPWVSVHPRAALFLGDVRSSPDLALALAARRLPLAHLDTAAAERTFDVAGGVYVDRDGEQRIDELPALRGLAIPLRGQSVRLPEPETAVRPADVRSLQRRNGTIDLTIHMAEPGLAVVAESYHPHWRATVDERPAKVSRISCGLMGLELGAGAHVVHMHFDLPAVYPIAGLTSLATLFAGLILARRQR